LSVFENIGKPNGIGIALGGLADTAMLRRDYDAARFLYERGLALRRNADKNRHHQAPFATLPLSPDFRGVRKCLFLFAGEHVPFAGRLTLVSTSLPRRTFLLKWRR
jgi:hypothetical protein